jgi:hypothetical protein
VYKHVYIMQRKDGQMISAQGYMSLLLDPKTGKVANTLSMYTNFRPFVPRSARETD